MGVDTVLDMEGGGAWSYNQSMDMGGGHGEGHGERKIKREKKL